MKIFMDDFIITTWIVIYISSNYVFKSAKNMALVWIQKNVHSWYFKEDSGFYCFIEQKLPDPKKIQGIVNMPPPKNPQHIQLFNGMAQFYKRFIKFFVAIMAPITKLTRKTKTFLWIEECQKAWELIKQKYIEALILISLN